MGKNGKYFCMPVANVLVIFGTAMALVNLLAIFFDLICFYALLTEKSTIEHAGTKSYVKLYVSVPCVSMYFVNSLYQCALCCKSSYENIGRFFKFYIVFVSIIAVCALIDAICKMQDFILASMFFFLFFIINILCIVVAIMAKHELVQNQQRELRQFNAGRGSDYQPSGHEMMPKFAMTINVESQNVAEFEPLHGTY